MDSGKRSFRTRILQTLGLSMALSGVLTYMLYKGLQVYYRDHVLAEDAMAQVRRLIYRIGDVNFFLIVFVPLAVFFFYLLTKPYVRYFNKISQGIHALADGHFDRRVELNTNDEFQSIAEDINRANEKLRAAVERGEIAESSKDRLVLNLAHDLRTPLTSVLGYLDYILKHDGLTAEQRRHFTTIAYTKSRRLEKLIEELFEVTRMNYGKLSVQTSSLDLSALLSQLTEELFPLFERSELVARVSAPARLVVEAEGESLARVFENLLTNAARYGKDGQFVDIECGVDDTEAVVRVTNYGDRIPEEDLPYLFDMFYTGDRARTHREGSTGLGLFIAKNIVGQHGGTISAGSDATRTQFEVRLPLPGGASAAPASAPVDAPAPASAPSAASSEEPAG